MRNLNEIIESVKSGERPEYEELRYALLVYDFMFTMDHTNLRDALIRDIPYSKFIADVKLKNSHDMARNALLNPPDEYLGWNSNPDNPEYQKRRKISLKIAEKFLGDKNG